MHPRALAAGTLLQYNTIGVQVLKAGVAQMMIWVSPLCSIMGLFRHSDELSASIFTVN